MALATNLSTYKTLPMLVCSMTNDCLMNILVNSRKSLILLHWWSISNFGPILVHDNSKLFTKIFCKVLLRPILERQHYFWQQNRSQIHWEQFCEIMLLQIDWHNTMPQVWQGVMIFGQCCMVACFKISSIHKNDSIRHMSVNTIVRLHWGTSSSCSCSCICICMVLVACLYSDTHPRPTQASSLAYQCSYDLLNRHLQNWEVLRLPTISCELPQNRVIVFLHGLNIFIRYHFMIHMFYRLVLVVSRYLIIF